MFGLFNKKQNQETPPEWLSELEESKQRWFAFLEKLEDKMEEFATAAIPELKQLLQEDDDLYKRTFHRVYSGVDGQIQNIRDKARATYEEKIIDVYDYYNSQISVLSSHHKLVSDFRNVCSDRYNDFEDKSEYWRDEIEKTQERDFEIEYQKIINEFEMVKNKFNCTQCGGNITIEKIFLLETYISCPYCKTQNTFSPSTQARNLQNIARDLAEQRTAHLKKEFEIENNKEREYYYQIHELELSKIHESDKKMLREIQSKIDDLEEQRKFAIQNAPKLNQLYLRAMYDELNKITPDLKEHNEKMYQNQLRYL